MANRSSSCAGFRPPGYAAKVRGTGLSRLPARTALLAAIPAACLSAPLHAQSSRVSGQVALASQLVDRGLAITPATPILQGSVTWTSSTRWSLSLAGGVEVRSPGRRVVTLARVSHDWALADDWHAQASLLYYDYGTSSRPYAADRLDASLYFTYRDVLTFGLSAIRVIDDGNHRLLGAADLSVHWPLAQHVSLSAGAGIAQATDSPYGHDGYRPPYGYRRGQFRLYGYGQLGLAWSDGPWHVELDRIVSSLATQQSRDTRASSRWVATLSWSF